MNAEPNVKEIRERRKALVSLVNCSLDTSLTCGNSMWLEMNDKDFSWLDPINRDELYLKKIPKNSWQDFFIFIFLEIDLVERIVKSYHARPALLILDLMNLWKRKWNNKRCHVVLSPKKPKERSDRRVQRIAGEL